MWRVIEAFCLSMVLLALAACAGHQGGSTNPNVQAGTASISVTAPSTQVIVPSASQAARTKEILHLYATRPSVVSGVPLVSGVPFKAALSGNGQMLAIGYTGGQLVIWNLDHAQHPALVLRNAVTTSPPVLGLAVSNDGQLLATAYAEDRISVWDIPHQESLGDLRATNATTVLKFSADSARLLAVSFSLDIFNIKGTSTGNYFMTSSLPIPEGGIADPTDANFGPNGLSVVAVTYDYFAVWNPGKTPPQLIQTDLGGLAVSPDGTKIVATTGDEVSVWDVKSRHEIASWHAPIEVDSATFLGNDQRLAVGGSTSSGVRAVDVFNISAEQLLAQYRGAGKGTVDRIIYDPHGLMLAMSQGAHAWPQHELDIFAVPH